MAFSGNMGQGHRPRLPLCCRVMNTDMSLVGSMWQGFSMASGGNTGYSHQAVLKTFTISSSASLHSAQALCFPFSTISIPYTYWSPIYLYQTIHLLGHPLSAPAMNGCKRGHLGGIPLFCTAWLPVGAFPVSLKLGSVGLARGCLPPRPTSASWTVSILHLKKKKKWRTLPLIT